MELNVETPHTAPGQITLLNTNTSSSLTQNSMTIYWEYGDMGTATSASMSVVVTSSTGGVIATHTINYPTSQKQITGLSATTQYTVTITRTTNIDSKVTITGNVASGDFTTSIDFSSINLCVEFYDFGESRTHPIYIKLYDGYHSYTQFVSGFGRPVICRETAKNAIDSYYNTKGIRKRESLNNGLIIQKYNLNSNSYGIKIFNASRVQTHHFETYTIRTLLNKMFVNDDVSYNKFYIHYTGVTTTGGTQLDSYFEAGEINIIIRIYPNKITSKSGSTEEPI
jgi:hypothetical protein